MDALIVIGLLIFTAILYKRLYWGLYLILFLLPTYLIRFKIGPIPFTFLEGMILILAAVWLFEKIKNKELLSSLKAISYKLKALKWPILLFTAAATISIFVSPNRISALGDWRAFFIEPLILFIIFLDLVRGEKEIKNVFYALGASAIYISLFIIYQLFTGFMVPENYIQEGRMTGFYGYPAAVGLYLAPVVAMFIGAIVAGFIKGSAYPSKKRDRSAPAGGTPLGIRPRSSCASRKLEAQDTMPARPLRHFSPGMPNLFLSGKLFFVFSIAVVIISIVALLATKTEGAYLGVLAATFIILMFTPTPNKVVVWGFTSWRKWVLIGSAILLVIVMVIPISRSYVIQKATFSDVSGDVRLVLWQGTFRALKANPIFGGGLSGFPNLYQKYKEDRHVELLKYPHNVILNFWSETGFLGLFAFLWLIFEFFRKSIKNYSLNANRYTLIAVMAAILSLLIYGLLDVPYFKNDLSILFWVLIGLSII